MRSVQELAENDSKRQRSSRRRPGIISFGLFEEEDNELSGRSPGSSNENPAHSIQQTNDDEGSEASASLQTFVMPPSTSTRLQPTPIEEGESADEQDTVEYETSADVPIPTLPSIPQPSRRLVSRGRGTGRGRGAGLNKMLSRQRETSPPHESETEDDSDQPRNLGDFFATQAAEAEAKKRDTRTNEILLKKSSTFTRFFQKVSTENDEWKCMIPPDSQPYKPGPGHPPVVKGEKHLKDHLKRWHKVSVFIPLTRDCSPATISSLANMLQRKSSQIQRFYSPLNPARNEQILAETVLLIWASRHSISMHAFDDPYFKLLLRKISSGSAALPSSITGRVNLTTKALPATKYAVDSILRGQLQLARVVSLTSDGWSVTASFV